MRLIVLGAGRWGGTLAAVLGVSNNVRLWCRDAAGCVRAEKRLEDIFSGFEADVRGRIWVEPACYSVLEKDDIVVMAVPSSEVRGIAARLSTSPSGLMIISASKGLEQESCLTMSQVVEEEVAQATVAVLSGPNISSEIASGRPVVAVLGCADVRRLLWANEQIGNARLHLKLTRDTVGIELCAALKGIVAIAAGISHGAGWGSNFLGLILCYGLKEILLVARFLGVPETEVLGIAGLGDLVATCVSRQSRNFQLGTLLAQGHRLKTALAEVGMVVEGAMTARTVAGLCRTELHIPLLLAIAAIVDCPTTENIKRLELLLQSYGAA